MAGRVGCAGDIVAQRFRALEYVAPEGGSWSIAKHLELAQVDGATSLTPGLRGDMNRQARRDQRWTGRPSSWGSREQDQNPSRQGAKGAAKGGPLWKSREGNQFGKGNKKGNKTWESARQLPLAPVGARWRPLAPVGVRQRPLASVGARWRPVAPVGTL